MSLVVIFPKGQEVQADLYLAFCNLMNPDTTPGAIWYQNNRKDKYDQRVVAYMGPGGFIWNGLPFPEPAGGIAKRAFGVLSNTVEWPDD